MKIFPSLNWTTSGTPVFGFWDGRCFFIFFPSFCLVCHYVFLYFSFVQSRMSLRFSLFFQCFFIPWSYIDILGSNNNLHFIAVAGVTWFYYRPLAITILRILHKNGQAVASATVGASEPGSRETPPAGFPRMRHVYSAISGCCLRDAISFRKTNLSFTLHPIARWLYQLYVGH